MPAWPNIAMWKDVQCRLICNSMHYSFVCHRLVCSVLNVITSTQINRFLIYTHLYIYISLSISVGRSCANRFTVWFSTFEANLVNCWLFGFHLTGTLDCFLFEKMIMLRWDANSMRILKEIRTTAICERMLSKLWFTMWTTIEWSM